ncbi:NAD-dependent formate dehydrogenase delta subunit [Paraburkholderia hospita]|uniref:NAD-dependent formate dehydrogenase delta subunit n=1 Tax=Paraburkholderia hospita TaxID=169430 RepID=A0ABN0F3I3_9BURK|nr:formate dehydrogenase subunit delta [Paraburkholderia hospita]EIM93126.1 NAD-dependent formate dehydrogenase delta subunit [Paraburkholderia hospita]OUL90257.1 formate dehydrogenase [Paraburkholderia hospita]
MNNETLVRMVNRIGDFFESMPDREQALRDIAEHVRKFWEPRMRREMLAYLDEKGGEGLSEIVLVALTRNRAMLEEGLVPDLTK